MTVGEALPVEMQRVRELSQQYAEMCGIPNVNVEPAIALMNVSLSAAEKAMIEQDVVGMCAAIEDLKGFES